MSIIIRLDEIYEHRRRKEQELEFYHKELEKLKTKLFFLQKDIEITNICIELIEKEKVVDVRNLVKHEDSTDH